MFRLPVFLPAFVVLTGCLPMASYSPPEDSGLVPVRAYPSAGDVCLVVGESPATQEYLDHTATLVGCPLSESGAIADRIAEGGMPVAIAGEWQLISIPD
ncbi:hypothetical protein [Gymnodinialimonas ulvae]|uniref:hypothetical protein n=1 Tax=Gymnodinialimonas ulvae TaxID=3126504 RepID=UPI00309F92DD